MKRFYILLLTVAVLLTACSSQTALPPPAAASEALPSSPASELPPDPTSSSGPTGPGEASGSSKETLGSPASSSPMEEDLPVVPPQEDAVFVPDPLDQLPEEDEPGAGLLPPSPESTSQDAASRSTWTEGDDRTFWEIREDMVKKAAAFREVNPDTVGWLYLGETTIDSPVFQTEDNTYYLQHNDYKAEDKNGAIVSDFRNRLTGRDSQSQNVVLYAHSKDEDPDGGVEASREFEHFTELKRYQKKDYCEAHPYFLFAAGEESMVFEVFAAFHTKTSFVYNLPDPSRSQMEDILAEAKKKSLFDFGVEVSPDDRIMTLSTCCRRIVPTYPNGYRFVVMGRLVEKGRPLEYRRTVTENPTALAPWNVYE